MIDETMLVEALVAAGLTPVAASEWIAQEVPIRVVGEAEYLWEGSVADKALILINIWGEPATAEDITEAIGECHRQAGDRYIVGAGCEIPRGTPPENVLALRDYARSQRPGT